MIPQVEYPLVYTFAIPVVFDVDRGRGRKERDIPHTNVHSCLMSTGFCTPFVEDTPGISTQTTGMTGDFTESGTERSASFEAIVELLEGYYTIIVHATVLTDNGDTQYDMAKGMKRSVLISNGEPKKPEKSYVRIGSVLVGVGAACAFIISIIISLYRRRARAAKLQDMHKEQTQAIALLTATAGAAITANSSVGGGAGRRDTVQLERDLEQLQEEVVKRKIAKKENKQGGAQVLPT